MLDFVNCFFCIYWYIHMIFIHHFVYVAYHVNWFVDIEPFLHSGSKSHFSWCMIFLMCCWIWFANISLGIFVSVHQRYWPIIFFCSVFAWFWFQGNARYIKWVWEPSLLLNVMKYFEKERCYFFLECLVKFTWEAIQSRNFVCWEIFDYCFNFTRCNLSIHILWCFLI